MTSTDDRPHRSALRVTRRSLLTVGAVGVGGVALAACSQAKAPADVNTGAAAPAGTTASAGTPTSAAAPGTSSKAAAPTSSAAAEPALAKLSDIKVGSAVAATGADGAKIIISRPTATTVAAFSAICTHQGCTVAPSGGDLNCPCHGSVFNALTGAVIQGPASRSLPAVAVKVSGTDVVAG